MKLLKSLLFITVVGLFASCSVTKPLTATNNPIGDKTGVAKNSCLSAAPLTRLAGGDLIPVSGGVCFNDKKYSLYDAAMDGDINKIATVDLKITNYIIFYKYELIVTGE